MAGFKYGMVCSQCGADGLSEVRVEEATGRDWCIPCAEKSQSQSELDNIDSTDIADWELSVEIELTLIAIPELNQFYNHPQLPWTKYL